MKIEWGLQTLPTQEDFLCRTGRFCSLPCTEILQTILVRDQAGEMVKTRYIPWIPTRGSPTEQRGVAPGEAG